MPGAQDLRDKRDALVREFGFDENIYRLLPHHRGHRMSAWNTLRSAPSRKGQFATLSQAGLDIANLSRVEAGRRPEGRAGGSRQGMRPRHEGRPGRLSLGQGGEPGYDWGNGERHRSR